MSVSSINRTGLICLKCTFKIDPAAMCTIHGRRKGENGELERLHFCSAVCWTKWLAAVRATDWTTMVLPPLTDAYDIKDVQNALAQGAGRAAA